MPDYQNGKIYTIRNLTDKGLVYVGSSCQKLCARWMDHKSRCKQTKYHHIKLYEVMNDMGVDDFFIELYEEFPCQNKEQLTKREGEVIREIGTLNQVIVGRSSKEYFQENKELILEKAKKYYKDNYEEILERKKEYYNSVAKLKYENNKEALLQTRKEKTICECGSTVRKADFSQHIKTKKHLSYMSSKEI